MTPTNERGTRCARKGETEDCPKAQGPILEPMSQGPSLLQLSRVITPPPLPLEWGFPIVHLNFPSPVLGKALLEGADRATGSRGGAGLTAATSSKDALCVPGRQPCLCPPACIQLAQELLSWEQQLSLAPRLSATRALCLRGLPSYPGPSLTEPWSPPSFSFTWPLFLIAHSFCLLSLFLGAWARNG